MKKLFVLVLMLSILLVGCTSNTSVSNDDVVAEINGEKVLRSTLESELKAAEKAVVEKYVNNKMLEIFYKDIVIEDAAFEAQLSIIKGQVGENDWASYLQSSGFTDEEHFKRELLLNMKREEMKNKFKSEVTISDAEVEAKYNENPNSYNVAVFDVIYFDTEESFNKGKELLSQGKDLVYISENTQTEIKADEHANFTFEGFTKPINELSLGELAITDVEKIGFMAIAQVKKLDSTFDLLKQTIYDSMISEKTEEMVNTALDTFYSEAEVTILGEKSTK